MANPYKIRNNFMLSSVDFTGVEQHSFFSNKGKANFNQTQDTISNLNSTFDQGQDL